MFSRHLKFSEIFFQSESDNFQKQSYKICLIQGFNKFIRSKYVCINDSQVHKLLLLTISLTSSIVCDKYYHTPR